MDQNLLGEIASSVRELRAGQQRLEANYSRLEANYSGLEANMISGFTELRDAMFHGFAQSEARDDILSGDIQALTVRHDRLEAKVDRIETRVEHLETDVGDLKTDMVSVKTWISDKQRRKR
jgi:outer membrane murein-binding lipoprotein Lpp